MSSPACGLPLAAIPPMFHSTPTGTSRLVVATHSRRPFSEYSRPIAAIISGVRTPRMTCKSGVESYMESPSSALTSPREIMTSLLPMVV